MKKLVLIIALSLGTYFGWEYQTDIAGWLGTFSKPDSANLVKKPLRTQNWKYMYRQNNKFDDLSVNGSYTVVFVTSPNCDECSQIQAKLNDFIAARNDVAIYRLNIQMNPSTVNNDNAKIKDHEKRFLNGLFEAYEVTSAPHIEVYSPTGELIASDRGDSKSGYKYFRKWIDIETRSKR